MKIKDKGYIIIYILIIAITSIPIMNGFLYRGHDIYFHLMRIEGLAQGLKAGEFPVKIQPAWYDGFGYAVSVFYGDLFLYAAAFIRVLGVSMQGSYKAYLLLVNIFTVLVSGYSFNSIFKNRYIGAFGAFLYSLSLYRLVNLYTRGAVGEYTAMAFLPLLAYAAVLLLDSEQKTKNLKKGTWLLGITMACILQSHILTAEISSMILAAVFLIYIKRVFNRQVIFAGIKAVAIAVVLSLWFLVPFIDYMSQGIFNINNADNNVMIQSQGVFLSQILALFDNAVGESLDWRSGREGDFAQGAGIALVAAIFLFVIIICTVGKRIEKKIREIGFVSLFFSVILLFMSSRYFPWDRLCTFGSVLKYVITNFQFPWRFTGMAVLMLVLLWCTVLYACVKAVNKKAAVTAAFSAVILSLATAGYYMYDLSDRAQRIEVYSLDDMGTYVASGEEYLVTGTDLETLTVDNLLTSDAEISDYEKKGTTLKLHCSVNNDCDKAIVELPLLYYKGYKAAAKATDGKTYDLQILSGANNVIRLELEAGSEYDITVSFKEPWYWRMAEIISLAAAVLLFANIIKRKVNNGEKV